MPCVENLKIAYCINFRNTIICSISVCFLGQFLESTG